MLNDIRELNGKIVRNQWIEWEHEGVPNYPKEIREIIRFILALLGHCVFCTALDGCWFVKRNMPIHPMHEKCHCKITIKSLNFVKYNAEANCPIEKFTKYIFSDDKKSKGKKELFEALGYNKDDSAQLKYEMEKQSLKNYLMGNYLLKNLDGNGQRIAIPIELSGKTFYTGWMIEPEGKIRNTTPFGGWIK